LPRRHWTEVSCPDAERGAEEARGRAGSAFRWHSIHTAVGRDQPSGGAAARLGGRGGRARRGHRAHGHARRGDRRAGACGGAHVGGRRCIEHAPGRDTSARDGRRPHGIHGASMRADSDGTPARHRAAQRRHLVARADALARGRAFLGSTLAGSARDADRGAQGRGLPPRVRDLAAHRAASRRNLVPQPRARPHGRGPGARRRAAPGIRRAQALRVHRGTWHRFSIRTTSPGTSTSRSALPSRRPSRPIRASRDRSRGAWL